MGLAPSHRQDTIAQGGQGSLPRSHVEFMDEPEFSCRDPSQSVPVPAELPHEDVPNRAPQPLPKASLLYVALALGDSLPWVLRAISWCWESSLASPAAASADFPGTRLFLPESWRPLSPLALETLTASPSRPPRWPGHPQHCPHAHKHSLL